MTTNNSAAFLAETIDKIEAAYEFMLAYAAQGRENEQSGQASGPSIRDFLANLAEGLAKIPYAAAERIEDMGLESPARQAMEELKLLLMEDADKARVVVKTVLAAPSISSQLVDNLNASVHLRCLLTDIFVIDEALKSHAKAFSAVPSNS